MILSRDLLEKFIPAQIRADIVRFSKLNIDIEYCGIVRRIKGELIAELCPNSHEDAESNFRIDSKFFKKYLKDESLYAIWHTHYKESSESLLSSRDMSACKSLGVPYILYHKKFKEWDFYDPKCYEDPYPLFFEPNYNKLEYYKNFKFAVDRLDCYELVRVFFKGYLGIEIKDYPRPESLKRIEISGWDVFSKELPKRGFIEVYRQQPKKYDVVLMRSNKGTSSHVGVMVGDREILHIEGEDFLSDIVIYGTELKERTVKIFAHKELLEQG
jgi:proteasome lid subunit RPN8/RPN11